MKTDDTFAAFVGEFKKEKREKKEKQTNIKLINLRLFFSLMLFAFQSSKCYI
jgi:hypothetical protein